MNIITSNNVRPHLASTARPATASGSALAVPQESFEESSVVGTALKSALVGAAYGALVGGSTNALYRSTDLMTATGAHMAGIAGGGALGSVVLGKALQKKAEPPAAYALGALAGAGVTWATSAFGMLPNPMVGIVAGATLGAFFGAVGGAIHASKGSNDRPLTLGAQESQNGLPKAAWKGMAVAYGVAGTALTGAMIAKGMAGTLTPGLAAGGGLIALGAFANAYLINKTSQTKG
jgi:hypothetical protein